MKHIKHRLNASNLDVITARRRNHLENWITIKDLEGLEVGPLDKPLVEKADSRVWYLDAMSEESLRQHSSNPNRNMKNLVKLDYVTGQSKVSQVVDRKFDYVVACHVLEHLPNFLGWLRDIASVLRSGGSIFAVVPDKRFTFDHLRPTTSLGELIENDRQDLQKPSFKNVFDQAYYLTGNKASEYWDMESDDAPAKIERIRSPEFALKLAITSESTYVDRHCNIFEPESFRESIECSHALGLQPFRCVELKPTVRPQAEFAALLSVH